MALQFPNVHIAPSTVEIASAREMDVRNAHREQLVFVLLMEEADDALFLDAIKGLGTNISAQPTGVANAAKRMDAANQQWADPTFARGMAVGSDVRSRAATSRLSRQRNFASSMVGARSASIRDARRLPEEGPCTVLRMVVASGAN